MATTTNYGWTTPDDTDLVKNGALAIRTLGSAIDTSMNTALGTKKAGLVLLNTTSFSAVSSQSVNDVFSSTYDNYLLKIDYTASAFGSLTFRLRVSGSDASGSNYARQYFLVNGTSVVGGRSSTQTSFNASDSENRYCGDILIFSPFLATPTIFRSFGGRDQASNTALQIQDSVGNHQLSTSYTGITAIVSSGNMTGSISIYGVNK